MSKDSTSSVATMALQTSCAHISTPISISSHAILSVMFVMGVRFQDSLDVRSSPDALGGFHTYYDSD